MKSAAGATIKGSAATSASGRRMLEDLGIRHRIAFPFSPKKAIAALNLLTETMSSPHRVEHPLLRLKGVVAVLWIADVRHFQAHDHPVTGTRWQAYPQGPVPGDIFSLLKGDPIWVAELTETDFAVPLDMTGDCITRKLRVRFGYDPREFLSGTERDALKKAVVTAKSLKASKRDAALRGEAFQLTPLYADIPWELLLTAKRRSKEIIDNLIFASRNTVL
jgi:antitoxin SocA-like protein